MSEDIFEMVLAFIVGGIGICLISAMLWSEYSDRHPVSRAVNVEKLRMMGKSVWANATSPTEWAEAKNDEDRFEAWVSTATDEEVRNMLYAKQHPPERMNFSGGHGVW